MENYVLAQDGSCKTNVSLELSINVWNSLNEGMDERSAQATIENAEQKIYCIPNPASDEATLLFDSKAQSESEITIFDSSGKQLQRQSFSLNIGRNIINLPGFSALPSGLLLIRVNDNQQIYTTTVLKK